MAKRSDFRHKFILTFLAGILFILSGIAQQVTNVRVSQEGDRVVIYYDLMASQRGQMFDIEVRCSPDGGKNFSIAPQSLSGDLKGVTAGTGRKIVWDVLNEQETLVGDAFVFQLKATVSNPEESVTGNSGSFTDPRDGEVYKWVKIGTQIWMAENLKATIFRDGTSIPNVGVKEESGVYHTVTQGETLYAISRKYGISLDTITKLNPELARGLKPGMHIKLHSDNNPWQNLTTGAYCWYDNNTSNKSTYGALYNWYAVNTGKLCPIGWHVPSDAEWTTLSTFLGGESVAGGKMTTTTGWESPNTEATNSSGFSALPGGYRSSSGSFSNIGSSGNWWSSTEYSNTYAWSRYLHYGSNSLQRDYDYKNFGFSVRCVRDF